MLKPEFVIYKEKNFTPERARAVAATCKAISALYSDMEDGSKAGQYMSDAYWFEELAIWLETGD